MSDCQYCGAPLKGAVCDYCGRVDDRQPANSADTRMQPRGGQGASGTYDYGNSSRGQSTDRYAYSEPSRGQSADRYAYTTPSQDSSPAPYAYTDSTRSTTSSYDYGNEASTSYQDGYRAGYEAAAGVGASRKSWPVAFVLCTFLGYFGAHRFYAGKWKTGILYLCTFGLFSLGMIWDLFNLAREKFTDGQGMTIRYRISNASLQWTKWIYVFVAVGFWWGLFFS